jgi:nucleotide-binding universal stress UspA family protein
MIILCAVDPNDVAFTHVLQTAGRLRRPEDVVHVVHVLPRPLEWYRDTGQSLEQQTWQERERLRVLIQAQLKDLSAQVSVPLGDGRNTGDDLVAVAEKHAAELIIMGTHGRKGLSALTLGSVAERVVRLAKCDVYVVRT